MTILADAFFVFLLVRLWASSSTLSQSVEQHGPMPSAGSVSALHWNLGCSAPSASAPFNLDTVPAVLFNVGLCLGRGPGLVNFESS